MNEGMAILCGVPEGGVGMTEVLLRFADRQVSRPNCALFLVSGLASKWSRIFNVSSCFRSFSVVGIASTAAILKSSILLCELSVPVNIVFTSVRDAA